MRISKPTQVIAIGIIISSFFALFFLNNIILNIEKPLSHHDDIDLYYFTLQNNFSKISNFDFDLINTRMFYPLKNTLAAGNSVIFQSFLGFPAYLLTKNPIVSTNFMIVINFVLSFLAMYILAYYFTKRIWSSVLAGVIYTYNPLVISQIYHMDSITLCLIPLIFLGVERIIAKITWERVFLLVILIFLQITASFYYSFFLIILLPIYFLVRVKTSKLKIAKFLNIKIITGGLILILVSFLYISPFLAFKKENGIASEIGYVASLSAKPTDFLFTTPGNMLYGGLAKTEFFASLRDTFSAYHFTEHSLFFGLVPWVLFILALMLFKKNKFTQSQKAVVLSFIALFVSAIIFSLGPFLNLFDVQIPMPYFLIYNIFPFADAFRAVSRFAIYAGFSLAVISAFVSSKMKAWIICLFIVLLSIEYVHIFEKPYVIKPDIREFYSWISSQDDIDVIVELPIANSLTGYKKLERQAISDAQYLLYGSLHNKHIINGYNSFVPAEALSSGNALTINFPTKDKLAELKELGVNVLVVHRDEFEDIRLANDVIRKLKLQDLENIYNSKNISAFRIK